MSIDRDLDDEAVALVHRWLADPATSRPDPGARRLAALLSDPAGVEFAVGFIDGVVRPEDRTVAARAFRRLAGHPPAFLSAARREREPEWAVRAPRAGV